MTSQADKARAFRALHERQQVFLAPNPWDAGTAKLLQSLGYEALATTSLGLANSLGVCDGEGEVSREALLANCRAIAAATSLPVTADLENGYAHTPREAARIITDGAATGIVGGSIVDSTGNDEAPIYDFTLAVERVHAAVEAARALPVPFPLSARAENFLHGRRDLDDTIKRLQAYEKAGADVLYAPGLSELDTIRTVCSSVGKPVNVVMSAVDQKLTVHDLEAAGVRRISVGGLLSRLALTEFLRGASEFKERGSFGWTRDALPTKDFKAVFRGLLLAFACGALPGALPDAQAQAWPSRPIRIVVPFPPGGGTDIGTRIVGQKLQEALGQPVVIENRAGASGIVGTEFAARAAPDGYTLMMGNIGTHTINPGLFSKLSYDPVKDFAPISQVALLPMFLLVNPSVPAASVKELVALAKAKPGQINYSSSGAGGMPHVSAALFGSMAGVAMVHIPYKGGGPAVADLIGGQVQVSFATVLESISHVKAGKLRALGVSSAKRSAAMPELPTIAEAGLPGYESGSWLALFAPAGTSREIVARLSDEAIRIVRMPDVREKLLQQGADPVGGTAAELAATQLADIAKYARVLREAGVKQE